MKLKIGDELWTFDLRSSGKSGFQMYDGGIYTTKVREIRGENMDMVIMEDRGWGISIESLESYGYYETREEAIKGYNSKVYNELDRLNSFYERKKKYLTRFLKDE